MAVDLPFLDAFLAGQEKAMGRLDTVTKVREIVHEMCEQVSTESLQLTYDNPRCSEEIVVWAHNPKRDLRSGRVRLMSLSLSTDGFPCTISWSTTCSVVDTPRGVTEALIEFLKDGMIATTLADIIAKG